MRPRDDWHIATASPTDQSPNQHTVGRMANGSALALWGPSLALCNMHSPLTMFRQTKNHVFHYVIPEWPAPSRTWCTLKNAYHSFLIAIECIPMAMLPLNAALASVSFCYNCGGSNSNDPVPPLHLCVYAGHGVVRSMIMFVSANASVVTCLFGFISFLCPSQCLS